METKHLFDLTIGEPGVGKSYDLITRALEDKRLGHGVYISTPTNASKQNLISAIYKRMTPETPASEVNIMKQLAFDIHVLESSYNGQPYIYMDEIGQTATSYFNSLLLMLQTVPYAEVHLYGDIKQLQPSSQLFSPVESLLRNNLNVTDFWDWVSDKAYDDFDYEEFTAPKMWQLDIPIRINLLTENHRLKKLGFTSYNNEFFDSIVQNNVVEHKLYHMDLLKAVEDWSAILVATKQRGAEADRIILEAMENNTQMFNQGAYFIKLNNKTYLNPNHYDYEQLEQKFNGIPRVTEDANIDNATYSYTATVHSMQGITVDSVTFFMGNSKIANGHKSHYSQNLLYTSVTRASDEIVLLGLRESFEKMRHQQPDSPQKRLGHYKADKAYAEVKKWLLEQPGREFKPWDVVYHQYEEFFNNAELEFKKASEVSEFNVRLDMYSEHELKMKFKDYPHGETGADVFKPDYKKFYTDEISIINANNGAKRAGRGRVQKYINSLSDSELINLKADVNALSVRKFKDKYNMAKKNVVKALSELESQSA